MTACNGQLPTLHVAIEGLLAAPFEVHDGALIVPDRPGNGIEWDEAAVKRLQNA